MVAKIVQFRYFLLKFHFIKVVGVAHNLKVQFVDGSQKGGEALTDFMDFFTSLQVQRLSLIHIFW